MGLYFKIMAHNITADEAEGFVAEVLNHFPRGIILVWDRWMVHRSAAQRLAARFPRRVRTEWLPAYAPDLNPVEQVWNRTKYTDLANYLPANVDSLDKAVRQSLRHTQSQQSLLRSFFQQARLPL
jgi:transposase